MMTGTWNFFLIYFTSFAKTNLTFLSKRSNFQHPSLHTHSAAKHYIRWSFTDWLCKRSETKLYCMFFNPIMKNLTKVPTWLKYACWNNWWNARHIQKHHLRVTGKPIRASPIKSTGGAIKRHAVILVFLRGGSDIVHSCSRAEWCFRMFRQWRFDADSISLNSTVIWLLLAAAPLCESLLLYAANVMQSMIDQGWKTNPEQSLKITFLLCFFFFVCFLIFKCNMAYNRITYSTAFLFKPHPVWLLHVCLCGSFGCVQVGAEECSNDQKPNVTPVLPDPRSHRTWTWFTTKTTLAVGFHRHHISWSIIKAIQCLKMCSLFFLPTYSKPIQERAQTMFIFITGFRGFRLRFHWNLHFPSVKEHRLKKTLEISPHYVFVSTGTIDSDSGYLLYERRYTRRAWMLVFHFFGV